MPSRIDPESIRAFKTEKAFESWLRANHDVKTELYLRLFKKDSAVRSITRQQAVDVALCWGWIDGIVHKYDEQSYLQRFTPRKPKSLWSQINRGHVARLIAAGRMTPHGLRHVEAAKADGRWDAAYASPSNMTVPDDLLQAIAADPKAKQAFEALDKQNRYAIVFRTHNVKTPAARARRIAAFVAMLRRGESVHPTKRAKPAPPTAQPKPRAPAKSPGRRAPAKASARSAAKPRAR